MSRPANLQDRLQPALLDRLTDDAPAVPTEGEERRYLSRGALRQAVLRDLTWLFNTTQPLPAPEAVAHPEAARSVLNFGLPPLAGHTASRIDVGQLEKAIRAAILRYEPRLAPEALKVRAIESEDLLGTHNVIEFEIRGQLWGQPVPLEMLLRTQLDLEAGQARVRDLLAASVPQRPPEEPRG